MAKIRIEHWQDVDPFSIKIRVTNFDKNHRFQMVALDGDNLIGYWMFACPRLGGALIQSSYTRVAEAYRRRAIAKQLWLAGINYYNTRRIKTTIGTWLGREFLAQMTVEMWIAHRTSIDVGYDDIETPLYHERVAHYALEALGKISDRKTHDSRLQTLAGIN